MTLSINLTNLTPIYLSSLIFNCLSTQMLHSSQTSLIVIYSTSLEISLPLLLKYCPIISWVVQKAGSEKELKM